MAAQNRSFGSHFLFTINPKSVVVDLKFTL
jgi:hypothetical protein